MNQLRLTNTTMEHDKAKALDPETSALIIAIRRANICRENSGQRVCLPCWDAVMAATEVVSPSEAPEVLFG